MNKELKNKWIEALRSGKYKQGKGALRTGDIENPHYCCLGVLCAISLEKIKGEVMWEKGFLPSSLEDYVCFDIQKSLTFKNDNAGWSFSEIADWIEKKL